MNTHLNLSLYVWKENEEIERAGKVLVLIIHNTSDFFNFGQMRTAGTLTHHQMNFFLSESLYIAWFYSYLKKKMKQNILDKPFKVTTIFQNSQNISIIHVQL